MLTSDDVTLISREGRVVYATPSALAMFGRDVTGDQVANLISSHRPQVPDDDDSPEPARGTDGYIRRGRHVVETVYGSGISPTIRASRAS